ncbi:MAG: DUF397 domain-containing protein [Streptosporangiaceae bacterium]|jgi:hypothetical protein
MEESVDLRWRKSSYSGNGGGNCVEVASNLPDGVAVRDSKNPDGPRLASTRGAWSEFVECIKQGEFDL